MSLQRYPNNPIERRKLAVRRYSRNGVICVGGGLVGGIGLALLSSSMSAFFLTLGLIIAVVGGGWNWLKVRKIINYKDQY